MSFLFHSLEPSLVIVDLYVPKAILIYILQNASKGIYTRSR